MTVWFTSDNHFGHRNIVTYCNRPFLTADGLPDEQSMNRTMTELWNSVVGPRDVVFHLGDFSMEKRVSGLSAYRLKLNGHIILVRGNHDRSTEAMLDAGFDEVYDRLEIEHEGLRLYLSHIPLLPNEGPAPEGKVRKYRPEFTTPPPKNFDFWLCGHVHERWRRRGNVINVGVDQWGFEPKTLTQLLQAEDENQQHEKP